MRAYMSIAYSCVPFGTNFLPRVDETVPVSKTFTHTFMCLGVACEQPCIFCGRVRTGFQVHLGCSNVPAALPVVVAQLNSGNAQAKSARRDVGSKAILFAKCVLFYVITNFYIEYCI